MHLQTLKQLIREGNFDQLRLELGKNPGLLYAYDPDDWEERTLLHCAARYAQLEIARFLVEQGAEVYSHPHNSYPPVFIANQYKVFPDRPNGKALVDFFLTEIPDKAEGTLGTGATIHIAARLGFDEVVHKHLQLDPLSVHQRGWLGDTPLHWACHNGHVEIVRMLLDAGADIEADEINCYGGKPLHWASEHEAEVVQLLLERGANVNSLNKLQKSDFCGITPLLMNACQPDDCAEATQLLLEAGARTDVRFQGQTALELASAKGNERISAVLRDVRFSAPRTKTIRRPPALPVRPAEGHKGTFGSTLIIAGSSGMSGAARLAGRAALHSGTGLVTVAVPPGIQMEVAIAHPSYMTMGLSEDILLEAHNGRHKSVALGPGMGRERNTESLIHDVYNRCRLPLVLDADGLNAFEHQVEKLGQVESKAPRILTPHPKEFSRLLGMDSTVEESQRKLAIEFAREHSVILLLKGHRTLITDGTRVAVNTTGTTALATGGSGDVLTGLIAGLLAQQMDAFEAAYLAAHLHGLAGQIAGESYSERFVSSVEIVDALAQAWKTLESSR